MKTKKMNKIFEAFLRGAIGTIIGLIPAKYFFDSIPSIIVVAGIGGIIGEIIIPKLLNENESKLNKEPKSTKGISKLIIGLIASIIFTFICFQVYMSYDKYEVGQKLRVVSFTNVRMTEMPFFKDKSNKLIDVLQAGEMVTYVSKQPKRLARKTDKVLSRLLARSRNSRWKKRVGLWSIFRKLD